MKIAKVLVVFLFLTPLVAAEVSVGLTPETDKTVEPKESIEIFTDASGDNLDSLKLYKKQSDERSWDFEADASGCGDGYCSLSKKFSYPAGSTVTFQAEASSVRDTAEKTVTINWAETSDGGPTADFSYSPSNPEVGETVTFSSGSSGGDSGIEFTMWDLDNDGDFDDASGRTAEKSFDSEGDRRVGIKVVEYDGSSDARYKEVNVAPEDSEKASVTLENPSDEAELSDATPQFEFSVIDEDGSSMEEVKIFYAEKDEGENVIWNGINYFDRKTVDVTGSGENIYSTPSEVLFAKRFQKKIELEKNTEYIWGVRADDGNTRTMSDSRTFTTGEETEKPGNGGGNGQELKIELRSPGNADGTTDRNEFIRPVYLWEVTDDDNELEDVDLYVEEKHGENDVPWSWGAQKGEKFKKYDVSDEVGVQSFQSNSRKLSYNTEYIWAIEVEDDGDTKRSEIFTFKTQEEPKTPPNQPPNQDEDPKADLDVYPESGEVGTEFAFDASDSTDDDGIKFYKFDFDGDGDVDRSTSDSVVSESIDVAGTKTAEVEVVDTDGKSDTASDSYEVTSEDGIPGIELKRPEDGAQVDPEVNFRWMITDEDDSSMQDTKLVIERKNFNGDDPWNNGEEYDVSNVIDSTQAKTVELEEDRVYVWGVKADDGPGGYHRSEVFDFRTAEDDEDDGDDGDDSDDSDDEDASLEVNVEDEDGDDLDADVELDGPEDEDGRTGSDGEIEFDDLEPGEYDVRVSEPGFVTEEREIELDAGEEEEIDFELERVREDVEVVYTRIPSSICRGDDLQVEFGVRNNGGRENLDVQLYAGSSVAGKEVEVDSFDTESFTITAENVDSEDDFNAVLVVENGDEQEFRSSVDVRDCGQAQDVSINVRLDEISFGERIEVSGYIDSDSRREDVDIYVGGVKLADVSTDRRGYYSTSVKPTQVGSQTVRANAGGSAASASVMIYPTVNVASMEAPERTFQSRTFEICAQVNSQVTPQVQLLKNGKPINSKSEEGNVCFETDTIEKGEHTYGISASAYGVRSGLEREVEVMETDSEVETFPSKVATVKAEDGIVSVDVFNNREEAGLYEVEVDGLPETWFTTTDKSFELAKGERKTVYFYFVPEREGRFEASVTVSRNGEQVQENNVPITADGTTQPQVTWYDRFSSLFPFW